MNIPTRKFNGPSGWYELLSVEGNPAMVWFHFVDHAGHSSEGIVPLAAWQALASSALAVNKSRQQKKAA